jgi:hypothetical protein
MIGTSVRITTAQAGWAQHRATKLGTSFNTVIRELIEDAKSFYGLPEVLREQLEAEAKDLHKEPREYVLHLLTLHAVELLNKSKASKGR